MPKLPELMEHTTLAVLAVLGALTSIPAGTSAAPDSPASNSPRQFTYTNRLINSNNPYLLLHAHNPVNWYPWGSEALSRARRENKPIFLSVGYSTCYWCHVAERTIYSDPKIAELMNKWFINIKVDREQRPDLDEIHMLATQIITGRGGWPNNVFLTPDLKPFFAGSYFPPADDGFGRPGFPTVLKAINEAWTDRRQTVLADAERVHAAMRQAQEQSTTTPVRTSPGEWLRTAREKLRQQFDRNEGGFEFTRGNPKFPREPALAMLITDYKINRDRQSLDMLTQTLDAMAYGGIYDHVGGGFHRYSTDPRWSIPHFEKMLYDNAQLMRIYAETFQLTGKPLYRHIAREVTEYLLREMTGTEGGFYTAQDAEVNGEEGASYLWSRAEIAAALGPSEAKRFLAIYTLTPLPQQPDDRLLTGDERGVLRIPRRDGKSDTKTTVEKLPDSIAQVAPLRAKLLAARNGRVQPARDDKMIVGLNGLAIGAFAVSGTALREPRYVAAAKRAAEFMWARAFNPKTGRLMHEVYRGKAQTEGFLEDYALLGGGFLSLFDATRESVWRERAVTLADAIVRRFVKADGTVSTTTYEKELLLAPQDFGDNAYPSATSAAIALLARLGAATANEKYNRATSSIIARIGAKLAGNPGAWATAVAALNEPATASWFSASQSRPSQTVQSMDTASFIRAVAAARSTTDRDEIIVTVDIAKGYHINANPASFDFLIPTSVSFEGLGPAQIVYPKPIRFKPSFAPDALNVYEGTAKIMATFAVGALKARKELRGTLTAQACNDEVCLPPSKLPISAKAP
ncbi:MAG: DUF255 domain-containing protein [Betaproteobacteria bacterium]|nr:DUF255 domain-containing protein [Betaproteobacteria bacterium]